MSKKMARVLSSVHAISTRPAVCVGPACVQHALARPDSQFLCCTRVYFLYDIWEIQLHSDDRHVHACNCSTFCTRTYSGSPYNVMHSTSQYKVCFLNFPQATSSQQEQKWAIASVENLCAVYKSTLFQGRGTWVRIFFCRRISTYLISETCSTGKLS